MYKRQPETDSQRASDATQVFDVNRAETVKPAAPSVPQNKEKEKNIGEMVFQSLFAEEESNQPVEEDAIPLDSVSYTHLFDLNTYKEGKIFHFEIRKRGTVQTVIFMIY